MALRTNVTSSGGVSSAQLTAAQAEDMAYTDKSVPWRHISKDGGSPSASASDNVAAFIEAKTALATDFPTQNGTICLSPGIYNVNAPLTWPYASTSTYGTSLKLIGSAQGSTQLTRTADVIVLDMSGTVDTGLTAVSNWVRRPQLENIAITGGDSSYTASLMRLWYSEKGRFANVELKDFYGIGLDAIGSFDHYFYGCFYNQGGGRDGAKPMVYLRNDNGATTGMGSPGNGNCNNFWWMHSRWERWRDGALWIEGTSTSHNNLNRVIGFKFENSILDDEGQRDHAVRLYGAHYTTFAHGDMVASARDATSTPAATDFMAISGTRATNLTNVNFRCISTMATTDLVSYINFDGTTNGPNRAPHLDDVKVVIDSDTQRPSNAFINWTGTNTHAYVSDVGQAGTTATTMPMHSGAPTSLMGPAPVLIKAGAPADTDFPGGAPLNGRLALDSTNHRLYVRDGAAWKYAGLT